jgi:hypothetical protein
MNNSLDQNAMDHAGRDESRREFVKAAGRLAVYTTPAMVMLMSPTPDAIASPGSPKLSRLKNNDDAGNRDARERARRIREELQERARRNREALQEQARRVRDR